MPQERLHHVEVSPSGSVVKRLLALEPLPVHIGSVVEQEFSHLNMATFGCLVKGGASPPVSQVHDRPVLDEESCQLDVPCACRTVQWPGSAILEVGLRIRVSTAIEEQLGYP